MGGREGVLEAEEGEGESREEEGEPPEVGAFEGEHGRNIGWSGGTGQRI